MPVLAPALTSLMREYNKAPLAKGGGGFGPGTIVMGSDIVVPDRMTTGCLALDSALGGGWPVNQWHEFLGEESSGKTTIILQTIAANQAINPDFTVVWVAAEYFDRQKAELDGVDVDRIIVLNENIMERCFEFVLKAMETKEVDLIVIDSLPAMSPGEEAEKSMEEFSMALAAKLTNKFFRKQGTVGKRAMAGTERPCTGFLVNQWRQKIGVQYGDPRISPGGLGKNFACFTRVDIRRDDWIEVKQGGVATRIGQTIKVRTLKNKSFPPQKVATFDYYFDSGPIVEAGRYDDFKMIVNLGLAYDIVKRRGSWYDYGEISANGVSALVDVLASEPDTKAALSAEVLARAIDPVGRHLVVEDSLVEPEPPKNEATKADKPLRRAKSTTPPRDEGKTVAAPVKRPVRRPKA